MLDTSFKKLCQWPQYTESKIRWNSKCTATGNSKGKHNKKDMTIQLQGKTTTLHKTKLQNVNKTCDGLHLTVENWVKKQC